MPRHFEQELAELKQMLLRMASLAEESLARSLRAFETRDDTLARQVEEADDELDRLQVDIDDRAIKLLALQQPTARDLRFVMMAAKINTDLERIGDQAVNIARRARKLNREAPLRSRVDVGRMGELARGMIHDTLDAFVYENLDKARAVVLRDKELDQLDRELNAELTAIMSRDPSTISRAVHLLAIAHNLERVGDHAKNIAEEVVYLYEARDIRHQHS